MKKRNKKKMADINYLDLIPEKSSSLKWHTDLKERVILEVENTGIMNKIAQNLFNKPRFTKVHLDANGSFIWPLIDGKRTVEDIACLLYTSTYLTELEEKRMNRLMCKGVHGDCSLYFTEGILKNPVKRNYQYEYAKRLRNKNIWLYHDKHRIVKHNIAELTDMLRKSLVLRSEEQVVLSDRGTILPSRLWRIGRSSEATVFQRELKADAADFVVDVLIDASGSQMSRQGEVALQAYIISEALSNVEIPHRVMSFCTFWDYTILHRFREYDDPRTENDNIFNYVTSSNNRDGLALKTAGYGLLQREEEKKILIVLSDGRPYDVIVNRPNARNPKPYQGSMAISDTGTEVRRLRNLDVSVLGVFAGEEKDLTTEKKIFGKDFAYIRDIRNFSKIVGRYLKRQMEV